MNCYKRDKKKSIIAILIAFAMLFSFVPATVVYADGAEYDFQPASSAANDLNTLKLLEPSDITVVSESDTTVVNKINTVIDGTQDIGFVFTMSAGMNNFNEDFFLRTNMPQIEVRDSDNRTVAKYDSGEGYLKYLGSVTSDEINNHGGQKTNALKIGIDHGVLDSGRYTLFFAKNICGNNTAKILGKDILFEFRVNATPELEILLEEVKAALENAAVGEEPGQYIQEAVDSLKAALETAQAAYDEITADTSMTDDEKADAKVAAAEILMTAYDEFKASMLIDVQDISINGIASQVFVGDSGSVNVAVTMLPDEEANKKVIWTASENILINENSGDWVALNSGEGWIRATLKVNPSVYEEVPVQVNNEDDTIGVVISSSKESVIDKVTNAVNEAGKNAEDVSSLKIFTTGTGTVDKNDIQEIRNMMPSLKVLDLKNVNVTSLGNSTFDEWESLEKVVLPDVLTSVGAKAFYNCTGLKTVEMPVTLEKIGASAFAGCTLLNTTLTVKTANPPAFEIEIRENFGYGDSFNGCKADTSASVTTIQVPYGCSADFKAADGWKRYNIVEMKEMPLTVNFTAAGGLEAACEAALDKAGYSEDLVTSITITSPEGVAMAKTTDIAYLQKHFLSATIVDLTGTAFPDNNIQSKVFEGRRNAKEIRLPDEVVHLGKSSFADCTNLRTFTVPENVQYLSSSSPGIGESAFAGCDRLTTLIMKPVVPPGYQGALPTSLEAVYVPNLCVADYQEEFSDLRDIIKPQASVSVSDTSVEAMKTTTLKATVDSVVPVEDLKWETVGQSTDNPVAVINEKTGVLTACRYGTVKVKVTAGDGTVNECSDTCTVTVTKAPAITLTVACASYNSIKLSWGTMSGAEGYQIFRAASKDGSYSLHKTVTARSYTDTGLTTGKDYYYKVRGYKTVNGVKVYGEYSAVKSAKPYLTIPAATAKRNSYNSNKISWGGISGATGYKVYRATSKSGTYSLIATKGSDVRSYVDTKRTTGKTYYYKVIAYRTINGKAVYSSYSAVKSAKPTLSKVTTVKTAKAGKRKIKVTWGKVSGATGYKVYRSTKKKSGFKAVKTVKAGKTRAYTSGKLTKNKKYYFKVRAYRTVNGKKVYGPYSTVVYRTAK